AGNELPQSRSCGPRNCSRFPCTLHLTQPRDINRHDFLDEDLAREFHVLPGSSQTIFHRRAIPTLVVIDELLNEWIEREIKVDVLLRLFKLGQISVSDVRLFSVENQLA